MICCIKGKVAGLIDHGFLLETGADQTVVVTTQTAGCELGLTVGDRVEVLGGPVGQGTFASSAAYKQRAPGEMIEVPVNAWQ